MMKPYGMLKIFAILLLALAGCASVSSKDSEPYVHVKRVAMWVPDLDRAILFYRDVLGFKLDSQGVLTPKPDSVLLDMFNLKPDSKIRRALFSSSTEKRALFIMETKDAPRYQDGEKRFSAQVIETRDLEAVKSRANALGFVVGNSNVDTVTGSNATLYETTIIGPGGQPVLVYQIGR